MDDTAPIVVTPQGGNKDLGCFPSQPAEDVVDDNFTAPTFDGGCSQASVRVTNDKDLEGCDRSWTRTWIATDCSGKETSVSQKLTWKVDDTAPVVVTPQGGNKDLGCNPTDINSNFVTPTFDGGCSMASVTGPVEENTSNGCNRTRKWTWTATDCSGKETVVSQTLSWKEDKTGPVITIADITAGECNTVTFQADVVDDCGPVESVEYSHPSGTVFPVGVTVVTVTALRTVR